MLHGGCLLWLLPPSGWRFLAVEPDVLLAGEEIQLRTLHTGQTLEVSKAGRINVDAA